MVRNRMQEPSEKLQAEIDLILDKLIEQYGPDAILSDEEHDRAMEEHASDELKAYWKTCKEAYTEARSRGAYV